jgi:glycosyltransferase involved in cell wall biosynthesis
VKLLYIITRAETGGAQVHVLELLKAVRHYADVELATGEEGFLTDRARELGIRVYLIDDLRVPICWHKDAKAFWQIRSLLMHLKPDLVHFHSSKAGMLGRLAARIAVVPSVFTAHGWAFTDGTSLTRKLASLPSEWLSARLGRGLITVSRYDFNLATKYRIESPERMIAIHNGMPDVTTRAEPGIRCIPKLVMVARFNKQKDHTLLLNALAGVEQEFRLQLVGDGPLMDNAVRLSGSLGLDQRVKFLGLRADVEKLLAEAQIFVLTSNYEGFPISIIEAMRAGLPVVASDVGGVRESVQNEENGFLIPRGDMWTLRDRLRLLISDYKLRGRMGAASRRRYEEEFSAERMVAKTLDVYDSVLAFGHRFHDLLDFGNSFKS